MMRKIILVFCEILAFSLVFYSYVAWFLPLPLPLQKNINADASKIYDRHGELLYEILQNSGGKKSFIPFQQIPKWFVQATLAAEDINFYRHAGVDFGAIFRAIFFNVKTGRIISGGSTITQQLARNLMGSTAQRNLSDKLLEAMYAVRLSRLYDKDHVLELYFNAIYYGNLAYGAQSAALDYFGKHIYELDLAESALLAGLPQAPSAYNPFVYFDQAKKRQKYVLDQMVKHQFVKENEAAAAFAEPLRLRRNKTVLKAPHFVMYIINQLDALIGQNALRQGGLAVHTTLDYGLQRKAEEIVKRNVMALADKNVTNGAMVAMEPRSGEILTWVGGKDYFDERIDGAVDIITSLRQPGSAIKPFNYLLALEKGYTPATIIFDTAEQFETASGPYAPKNYDLKFHGPMRLREALASSLNMAAVKTLDFVGVDNFITFLRKFGIDTFDKNPDYYGLALTLGGGEVRMLNLAGAYNILANYGVKLDLSSIKKITGSNNKLIYSENISGDKKFSGREFILGENGKEHAWQIVDILSDPSARLKGFGEGSVLELSRQAAVKTGTTRNFRDNWTIGFTPQLLTAVWVGNADARPMNNISGIDGAGPIWHDFMESALAFSPKIAFKRPHRLKEIEICAMSGKLPTEDCRERVFEWFVPGEEPKDRDNYFKKFWLNKLNGKLVPDACVGNFAAPQLQQKVMVVYPAQLQTWAAQNNLLLPEGEQCAPSKKGDADLISKNEENSLPIIENPRNGDEYSLLKNLPANDQKIPFRTTVPQQTQKVTFLLDSEEIATQKSMPFTYFWAPVKGKHHLNVKAVLVDDSELASKTVSFEVRLE